MLFILDDSVFEAGNPIEIIGLLATAGRSQRHAVIARNPDSDAYSTWLAGLNERLRRDISAVMGAAYRRAAQAAMANVVSVTGPPDAESISEALKVAVRHATRRFSIYVENSRNDKLFLVAACTEAQRTRLAALEDAGELAFVHGGGNGELKAQLAEDFAGGRISPQDTFVFFDSDSLLPDTPTRDAARLQATCRDIGVPHALLKRRAIENYVTRTRLRDWVYSTKKKSEPGKQRRAAFAAFLGLSQSLANHYNMKRGLAYDRRRPDYPVGDRIYIAAGVGNDAIAALERGFGEDLASSFEWPLPETELRAEGSWEEIQGIIQHIERLL